MASLDPHAIWSRLRALPGGGRLFGWLIGRVVPYAGTIPVRARGLERGRADLELLDTRRVRNHLGSIHAVALVNLAELAANLALMTAQPAGTRWIVTGMEARYLKKARGTVRATCAAPPVDWSVDGDAEGQVQVTDGAGDVVTEVRIRWRVGPAGRPA